MPRQRDDSTQDEEEEDEGALDLPIAHRKRRRRGDDSPTATSVSASAASASVSAAASAAPSPPNEHSPEEEGDKGISTRPKRRATTSRRGEQEEDKRDFKLVVKSSQVLEVGQAFSLRSGSELTIGRQPSMSNIVVKDLMVSKQHARLTAAPSLGPCVYDLKSKHGTVASVRKPGAQGEGDQVKRFPVPVPPEGLMLRIGDQVTVGGTVLVLELADEEGEPAALTSDGGSGDAASR